MPPASHRPPRRLTLDRFVRKVQLLTGHAQCLHDLAARLHAALSRLFFKTMLDADRQQQGRRKAGRKPPCRGLPSSPREAALLGLGLTRNDARKQLAREHLVGCHRPQRGAQPGFQITAHVELSSQRLGCTSSVFSRRASSDRFK